MVKNSKETAPYPRTVPVECLDRKINTAKDHYGERYLVNPDRQDRILRFDIPVQAMMGNTTFYRELLSGKKIRGVALGRGGVVLLDLNYDIFLQICLWLTQGAIEDVWDHKDPAKARERWSELREKAEYLGIVDLPEKIREAKLAYPNTMKDWSDENQEVLETQAERRVRGHMYQTDVPKANAKESKTSGRLPRVPDGSESKTPIYDQMLNK